MREKMEILGKEIFVVKVELERLRENRKIIKWRKENRREFWEECKFIRSVNLVVFMEEMKLVFIRDLRWF